MSGRDRKKRCILLQLFIENYSYDFVDNIEKILFYLNTGALIKHDRIGKEFIMNEWLIMNRISNSILSFFLMEKCNLNSYSNSLIAILAIK